MSGNGRSNEVMKLNRMKMSTRVCCVVAGLCVAVCAAACSNDSVAASNKFTFPDWTVGAGMLDGGGLPMVDGAVPAQTGPCASNNGGCDALTVCSAEADSVTCSACPAGYIGSGETGCIVDPTSPCATNNGGCDGLTSCTTDGSNVNCGDCPSGYTGTGLAGCVAEVANPCATDNGGCALVTTCSAVGSTVTCGDCPAGYMGTGASGCTIITGSAWACDLSAAYDYCAEYKHELTAAASAAAICDASADSQGVLAVTCPTSGLVGICILAEGTTGETWTYYYTSLFDSSTCTQAGGRWQAP